MLPECPTQGYPKSCCLVGFLKSDLLMVLISAMLRWLDKIHQDIKKCGIEESSYSLRKQRIMLHGIQLYICNKGFYQHEIASTTTAISKLFINDSCHCSFRREQTQMYHNIPIPEKSNHILCLNSVILEWLASSSSVCVYICVCECKHHTVMFDYLF